MKPSKILVLVAAAATLLAWGRASAQAIVSFATPENISGDSDINTAGQLDYAVGFYNNGTTFTTPSTPVVVNGVTFASSLTDASDFTAVTANGGGPYPGFGNSGQPANGAFAGLSANYQTVLTNGIYSGADIVLTLKGLTIGNTYEVQLFENDSRDAGFGRTINFYSTAAGSIQSGNVDYNTTDVLGGVGQYVIGTFIATGTTEVIDQKNGAPQLNAFDLRDLTPLPEPATWALLAAGLGALALVTRRRAA